MTRETTWAWGAEKKSKYEIQKLLEIGLNGHDIKFNASRFGIDQFEESDYSQSFFELRTLV